MSDDVTATDGRTAPDTSELSPEQVWLVGFRLDPERDIDREGADVYCLLLEFRNDGPVASDGYTIFFRSAGSAGEALRMDDDEAVRELSPPAQVDYIYDLAEALYLISSEDQGVDSHGAIVDCLNVMFDLVRAIGLELPEDYKLPLHELADYMTFDSRFENFFRDATITRNQVYNGLLWMMGAILSKAKLI